MSEQLSAIYAALDFIEGHLRKDVTIEDIAAAAGYSLYHFIRTFNQAVHHTPYNYLMRRRLSEAGRELIISQRHILDIAFDYQFNNPETFSRAFKRMFGMQPSQWRSRGFTPYRSLLPALSLDYLVHINQRGIYHPKIVEIKTTHLIGLMAQGLEHVPRLWQDLKQILDSTSSPRNHPTAYQVHTHLNNEQSYCFVGVESPSSEPPTPPLVTSTLPNGPYAQVTHVGGENTHSFSLDYIYHTWIPNLKPKLPIPKHKNKDSGIDPTMISGLTRKIEVDCFGSQFPTRKGQVKQWVILIPLNL